MARRSAQLTIVLVGALVVVLFKVADLLWQAHQRRRMGKARGCQAPPIEPTKWPLGLDLIATALRADREQRAPDYMVERFQKMGPRYTWQMQALGTTNIVTADPDNIKAILATQFHDFGMGAVRTTNFKAVLGRSIFAVDGAAWHASREVLRPIFSRENISDLPLLEKHFQIMLQCMPVGPNGWTDHHNIVTTFARLTLDSSTELFLGKSCESQLAALGLGSSSTNEFHGAFERMQDFLATRLRLRNLYWLYASSELKKCATILHRFVDDAIAEARARRPEKHDGPTKYDLVDALLARSDDATEVRDHVLGLFAAGRDTTAALMGWTFYCLIRNPRVFQRLRQVILAVFGSDDGDTSRITFDKLKGCSYLQHVLQETLRLHSVVPFNSRRAIKDTTLPTGGGRDGTAPVFVTAGMEVHFSTHVLHRRHDLWGEDADTFVPERWEMKRPGWSYAPFNGGPRICIGQQYALTEAGYIITRLVQRFEMVEGLNVDPTRDYHRFALVSSPGSAHDSDKARFKLAGGVFDQSAAQR